MLFVFGMSDNTLNISLPIFCILEVNNIHAEYKMKNIPTKQTVE
jgi:hypothetical protein